MDVDQRATGAAVQTGTSHAPAHVVGPYDAEVPPVDGGHLLRLPAFRDGDDARVRAPEPQTGVLPHEMGHALDVVGHDARDGAELSGRECV
jgi:hypothetical protein